MEMSECDASTTDLTLPDVDTRVVSWARMLCLDAVELAQSGHPGGALAATPAAHLLFARHLRYDPEDPAWEQRDRFILSAGHASIMLYVQLLLSGFHLEMEDIRQFRQLGSRTPGHPEFGQTPGVEMTTGPLGQGLASGVGMAMALKHRSALEGCDHPYTPHVWIYCGDGDLQEGVSYEAASLAGHLQLDNLTLIFDDNGVQIDGSTDVTTAEDIEQRFCSQGWNVIKTGLRPDGDIDLGALDSALSEARRGGNRPTIVMMRSQIAWPSPQKVNSPKAHGEPLGALEVAEVRAILGVETPPFEWSAAALAEREARRVRSRAVREEIEGRTRGGSTGRVAASFWEAPTLAGAPEFAPGEMVATRDASGAMIQHMSAEVPGLWGGSADLSGPNRTEIDGGGVFGPESETASYLGRNIRWGVREAAMAAAMNGIALANATPVFSGTFLVFSDYQRPAIRLACLMGLPVTYVWSHDSVAVGHDGPTHQPIEHLSSLRLIPGLSVVRPADANETVAVWTEILRRQGPAGLCLGRQAVPVLDVDADRLRLGVARGAYALNDVPEPDVVVVASGSEVTLAVSAAERFENRRVRVVSAPCLEWFQEQPQEYRESVIPPRGARIIAVEAGAEALWHGVVGAEGAVVGINRFGASGPAADVLQDCGLTTDAVVAAISEAP